MADFQYRSSEFYGTRGAIYFPMQNVKSIDNQLVKCTVVQMWFKSFGNNFHVFGTKTDSKSLR